MDGRTTTPSSHVRLALALGISLIINFASAGVKGFTPAFNPMCSYRCPVSLSNCGFYNHALPKTGVVQQKSYKSQSTRYVAAPLHMWNNNDDSLHGRERVLACIPYLLPLLDLDPFGRYIFMRIPLLGALEQITLGPILAFYNSIPLLGLGLFILLSFGSRNANLSRGVRFSMQQAILLDIALIFPGILGSVANFPSFPRIIVEPLTNFVYYTFIACILYSIVSNLSGKKPAAIPIISEAAEQSLGPF